MKRKRFWSIKRFIILTFKSVKNGKVKNHRYQVVLNGVVLTRALTMVLTLTNRNIMFDTMITLILDMK